MKQAMNISVRALVVATLVTAIGCTTMTEIREDARSANSGANDEASRLFNDRAARGTRPVQGPVITDMPFVDITPVPVRQRMPLVFNRIVTFNEPVGVPLSTLAQRLREMTGLQVAYQPEIMQREVAPGGGSSSSSMQSFGLPSLPDLTGMGLPQLSAPEAKAGVAITYKGPVVGLLDRIASTTGSSWEWSEPAGKVTFYKFKTASFRMASVQGAPTSSAVMGGSSSGSSGVSGSGEALDTAQAESKHVTQGSLWTDVSTTLKALISPEGVYTINEVLGTVVVRDVPDRVAMVKKYLDDMNDAMSRQVDVEVIVYRVMVKNQDHRGLNWNVMFQNLIATSPYNLALKSVRPEVVSGGLSSAVLSIPELDENGVPHRYGGSQMFVDALSTLGNASVVTRTSVITSNNQPAPVKVVKRTSYLAETTPNYGSSGGNTISTGPALTPGMIETGLNVYVLPHVQDDGKRMLLKLMVSLSTLEAMDTYGSGDNSIQLPQVASREFQQQAWINSGETLVLAGFEQVDAGLDTSSPLDKRLWPLGGKSSAMKDREIVVVAIRPVVTAARSRI